MRLVPFDPSFGDYVHQFYADETYLHFARGNGRYLTRLECAHLPEVRAREVLIPLDGQGEAEHPCGIVTLGRFEPDVIYGSLAIDKKFQGKKLMYEVEKLVTDYCFNIGNAETLRMDVMTQDAWLIDALVKVGWVSVGSIPEFMKVRGVWEATTLLYKKRAR